MLHNLSQVALQVVNDVLRILTVIFRQFVQIILHDSSQIIQQFVGYFTEIDDEVQRILYLMCDARTECTE